MSIQRLRMRRRLRRQRQVREALLLDLGALVFELQRQGERAPELLQQKAAELTAVDDEVRALEEALDGDAGVDELVAAGIVGTCAGCGALLSVGDGFCPSCGAPVAVAERVAAAEPAVEKAPDADRKTAAEPAREERS